MSRNELIALATERHERAFRLVTDFDMSGWAKAYATRIEEIDAILARAGYRVDSDSRTLRKVR